MATRCEPNDEGLRRAAEVLAQEGVVAFPTETVYGLGGSTFSVRALERIYALKGRPADNPLIAHVLDAAQAQYLAAAWDDRGDRLARAFWPGPLAIIVPRAAHVPTQATGGRSTIALRSPAHPVARALLQAFGGPISAPSANPSGRTSATTAAHVLHDFAHVPDLPVLDGGPCAVGIESTVVDLTQEEPVVRRPGAISARELADVLGCAVHMHAAHAQGDSPGTAAQHYAPVTPAVLVAAERLEQTLRAHPAPCAVLVVEAPDAGAGAAARDRGTGASARQAPLPEDLRARHHVIVMPAEPAAYAAALYDRLRAADAAGCARIVIQEPGEGGADGAGTVAIPERADDAWAAVRDRLRRATATRG